MDRCIFFNICLFTLYVYIYHVYDYVYGDIIFSGKYSPPTLLTIKEL